MTGPFAAAGIQLNGHRLTKKQLLKWTNEGVPHTVALHTLGGIYTSNGDGVYQSTEHRTKKRGKLLKDYVLPHHKLTTGGVKSGDGPTEYSITIDNIKFLLRGHRRNDGWMTVDEILETIQTHYANPKPSVMATLQAHWNQDWCEAKVEEGKRYFRYKLAVAR